MARSLSQLFYAMGGSVSTGKSNDELVDNLVDAEFIRTPTIQRVFRAVDRGNYYHPNHKQNAYKDIAWKMGNLHLSAPCVYSVVMEALKLKAGLSFLNLGSGSGYLSTMVGLILGPYGTNHGIEFHSDIVEYAYERLDEFLKSSKIVDECDFCEPVFTTGNCLSLENTCLQYDRVYCGAACPTEYETYIKNLVKVNGILIMPINDKLLKITRTGETTWSAMKILSVSFAPLIPPPSAKKGIELEHAKLGEITPPNLQQICRFLIRSTLRQNVDIEHPKLKLKYSAFENGPKRQIRRIVIPFFDESDFSNSQSDSDLDYDSDSTEYTISSHLPARMSVFLEDFLRRHAELQLLKHMEDELNSSGSDSETQPSAIRADHLASGTRNRRGAVTRGQSNRSLEAVIDASKQKTEPNPCSDESDSNYYKPPSQSTRSKRKINSKRKGGPSTSNNEPKKKILRTTTTVVWKKTDTLEKDTTKKEDSDEGPSDLDYTDYMIQKIGALPLPTFLLHYLNYRRGNL